MTNKILIVEDDAPLAEWLSYELEAEGYNIKAAANGLTALEMTQIPESPDLILLDVQLPALDGFQLCRILQDDASTAGIPVIFLTARTTLDDKLTGFDAGGVDYMTKPFTMAELKARVKAALHRRDVERQRTQASLESYKNNLSQNMSHELLTPMSIVLSALDVMENGAVNGDSSELRYALSLAQNGAHHLHWLIQDLLLVRKILQNGIVVFRQPVDLTITVNSILEQVSLRYKDKKLDIDTVMPDNCMVHIMRNQMQHILHHLMDNACKFSPEGGRVELVVNSIGQAGVEIFVRDEGPGIEPYQRERVFDKFFQVDMSITRPRDGLGVGLYIARTLTRIYDGDVTIETEPGPGTTFCLTLPDVAAEYM